MTDKPANVLQFPNGKAPERQGICLLADSNVEFLPVNGGLPIPPDRVLRAAEGKLEKAIVVGIDTDGNFYIAASYDDKPEINLLLDEGKRLISAMYFGHSGYEE